MRKLRIIAKSKMNGRIKIFVPNSGIPCQDFYSSSSGCSKGDDCNFLHEHTTYFKLLKYIESAKSSIDVCVFCLTCGDLGTTLITKSCSGARVRVITDAEQMI